METARNVELGGGRTLLEWLSGEKLKAEAQAAVAQTGWSIAMTRGVEDDIESDLGKAKAATLRKTLDAWVDRSGDEQHALGEDLRRALTVEYGGQVRGESAAQIHASASPRVNELRQLLAAQYLGTQQALAERYPSGKVTLWRGVSDLNRPEAGMTSWSLNRSTAEEYARRKGGFVLELEADLRDIWACPFSSEALWRKNEAEFMVLSRGEPTKAEKL